MFDPTKLIYLIYGCCGGMIFLVATSFVTLAYCAGKFGHSRW